MVFLTEYHNSTDFYCLINVIGIYIYRVCWGNVTFPGIGFPANTFISNVSMYFGATKK